jgi:ketosteroid isomerase-like protein
LAIVKKAKFVTAEYYAVKVTVFGDTAIATGEFKGKGTDGSGRPYSIEERWPDTWVKMANGKWQCVASHDSPVKM